VGDLNEKWHRNFEASQKRAALKKRAVNHLGGRCRICGYDNHVALEFHHIDPREKGFEISDVQAWARIVEELKKCELVCSNCHREIHAGFHPEYLVGEDEPMLWD
jgi:predicted HNH restriction endonuclease